MFANFTQETCTGTGATLTLAGVTAGMIPFSASFADGDLVSYVVEDSGGTIKVAGIGTYVLATNSITRNDTWNYNGTVVDKNPATNITLSGGTHTVRCDIVERDSGGQQAISTWIFDANYSDLADNILLSGAQSDTVTANQCTFMGALFERPRVIASIGVKILTADAVATVSKAGIFRCNADGTVGSLIESVSIDVSTTGMKKSSLIATRYFPAGWYYTAFASNGTPQLQATKLNDVAVTPHGKNHAVPRIYHPKQTLVSWTDLPATPSPVFGENYAPIVYWS